jgi:hypothetical protein
VACDAIWSCSWLLTVRCIEGAFSEKLIIICEVIIQKTTIEIFFLIHYFVCIRHTMTVRNIIVLSLEFCTSMCLNNVTLNRLLPGIFGHKMGEVTRDCRRLRIENLYNLYFHEVLLDCSNHRR